MFQIKIAELLVQVDNRYDYFRRKCKDYLVEYAIEPDLIIKAEDEDIRKSQAFKINFDGIAISDEKAEYDAAPYKLYPQLADYDAFWLHAAVVEKDGGAYAFSAPCGYGKSTHVKLWLEAFGDDVRVINGDNPIIRLQGDSFIAYGTPFCGKEKYQVNIGVPLKGICFLRHDSINSIEKVEPIKALYRLINENWSIRPEMREKYLDLYLKLVESVPVYLLKCNQEVEAAHVAWEGMRDK